MTVSIPTLASPTEVKLRRRRTTIPLVPAISLGIVAILVHTAIFAPWLAPYNPTETSLIDSLTPPIFVEGGSTQYLLGTDLHGRDQLSRLIYGARISVTIVLIILVIKTIVGVSLGILAGFKGGWWDNIIMRIVDMTISFPSLLIAIVIAVVFTPSFQNVIIVISMFFWAATARLVRAEVLALKATDYVTLARCAGASNFRIMVKHILPGVVPTVLVITTLQVGAVILFESSLSFLGVGIPPPNPSWGSMIADGRAQLNTAPWLSLVPGVAIFLTVLAMNSLGDWLRDWLDPRLRSL